MTTITMHTTRRTFAFALVAATLLAPLASMAQRMKPEAISVIERAMTDELKRSQDKLHLSGLVDPFFISYTADDNEQVNIAASFGALTRSNQNHNRALGLRLLVNNYQFNDENFNDASSMFGGGGASSDMTLPLDDDYNLVRRGFWLATDNLFKDANETFTKKKAALERKQLSDEDRNLPDFSKAPKVEVLEEPIPFNANVPALEALVKKLSAVFLQYKAIQNCSVTLSYSNSYSIMMNSEGSHTRTPQSECDLNVQATAQAEDDGEPLSLAFTVSELSPAAMPSEAALLDRTEKLAKNLAALAASKKFDGKEYSGPVLFEDGAGTDFISEQIISKFSAKREDVLGGGDVFFMTGAKGPTFQKKLDTRVLPASVSVIDDPNPNAKKSPEWLLSALGRYSVDEEGVVPGRLELVKDGILKTLYMTRTPTKEVKEPNGHARPGAGGGGGTLAGAGIVELTDSKAKKTSELRSEMFKIAKEDGYSFGIVVRSTQSGLLNFTEGLSNVSDLMEGAKSIRPSLVYKVYPDGKEELLRGVEIGFPTIRDLKELKFSSERSIRNVQMPAGSGAGLFGFASKVPATLIAPNAILATELEVHKKQSQAFPIKPIVTKP